MKTRSFAGVSRDWLIASLVTLGGCPDDVVNPFESGTGSSSGSSSGVADDLDDGADDTDTTVTSGVDTTMGIDDADSSGTADSTGSTSAGEDSSTGPGDDTTTDGGSESSSSGESSSDGAMGLPCPADAIDMIPGVYNGSTNGQQDEFGSMCGGNGAPDFTYTLQAPQDGYYVFNTQGSSFDTVLYVLDGDCGGPVMACNDDTVGTSSEVGVVLTQDQIVTVVVDSFGIVGGAFTLTAALFGGTCPDADIGNTVPQTTFGETLTGDNTLVGSCGGATSNDTAVTFTAPLSGLYTFDTIGSDFDTVLYVRNDCSGTQLACNNDIGGGVTASQVNVSMVQNDTVVVVVDGDGENGNYQLNVGLDVCPDDTLASVAPQTVMGSTAAQTNASTPPCAFSTASDHAYVFVAPADGTYIFDTFGSTFDTILHAFDGAACSGTSLACNDDTGGLQSQIALNLAQDQEVTIVVDGFSSASGAYTLNVDVLGGDCPNFDLGNTVPATASGNTAAGDNTTAGTCGGLAANDDIYTFTAPAAGLYVFDTIGSVINTTLYVRAGDDCTGAELGCAASGTTSSVPVGIAQDEVVTVIVDGVAADGAYTLNVALDPCPDDDLGMLVPQTVAGSTVGASNSVNPTCAFSNAPDYSYTFTAPAAGNYTFDTFGSTYDTLLHATEGNICGGAELACNDDAGGTLQSEIVVNLAAGEEIIVHVDGWASNSGNYTLNVD